MTAAVVERVRAAAMGDDRVKGTVTPLAETLSEADAAVVARRVAEAIQAQRQQLQTLQGYHDDNRALCNVLVQLPDLVSYDIMVLHTHTPPFELLPFFLLSKLNFPLKKPTWRRRGSFLAVFFVTGASSLCMMKRITIFLGLLQVPFGKAAFMPGRLIHTNEFLV